jgi:hypothetical protein
VGEDSLEESKLQMDDGYAPFCHVSGPAGLFITNSHSALHAIKNTGARKGEQESNRKYVMGAGTKGGMYLIPRNQSNIPERKPHTVPAPP